MLILRELSVVDVISLAIVVWMFVRLIKAIIQTVIFTKKSIWMKKMYNNCFKSFISKKAVIVFDSPITIQYGKFVLTFNDTKEGLKQFETCIVQTLEYYKNMSDLATYGKEDESVIELNGILLEVQNKLRVFEEKV